MTAALWVLLQFAAPAARAEGAAAGCQQPKPAIFECPEAFMPAPHASRSADGIDPRPAIQARLDEANALADKEYGLRLEERRLGLEARQPLAGDQEREAWLRKLRERQELVRARDKLYAETVSMACDAYGLRPPVEDPFQAARGRGSPIVRWAPRFSARETKDPVTGEWRPKTRAELELELRAEKEYGRRYPGTTTGLTRPGDGDIRLFRRAFSSPDSLALAVFHETQHWVYAIVEEGRGHHHIPPALEYRRHADIYEREAAFAREIGVSPQQERFYREMAREFRSQARECEEKRLNWDRILASRRYDSWRQRGPHEHGAAYEVPRESPPYVPTPSVAEGTAAFLLAWRDQSAPLVEAMSRMRAAEQTRDRQDRLLTGWAARCGLTSAGGGLFDYYVPESSKGPAVFRFQDEEEAYAAFMVAGACARPERSEPCVAGLEVLDRRWSEEDFRDSLLLAEGSGSYMVGCVSRFVDEYRPGGRFAAVQRIVAGYREEYDRRLREAQRPSSPAPEAREPAYEARPQRGGSRDDGCGLEWDSELGVWLRCARP